MGETVDLVVCADVRGLGGSWWSALTRLQVTKVVDWGSEKGWSTSCALLMSEQDGVENWQI